MLPQPVADTARRTVAIVMQDRRATFQKPVADVITEMNERGVLMSGMTVQRVSALVTADEVAECPMSTSSKRMVWMPGDIQTFGVR